VNVQVEALRISWVAAFWILREFLHKDTLKIHKFILDVVFLITGLVNSF